MGIGKIAKATALAMLGLAAAQKADAAYVAFLYQDGANVVATGSGSLNLTDLSYQTFGYIEDNISASAGYVALDVNASLSAYGGISGPGSFGSGSWTAATTGTGSPVGLQGTVSGYPPLLFVPENYTSGSDLGTSDAVFENKTLADLGVINGVYAWTWGSEGNADSFTLTIGDAPSVAVPEPGSLALLGAGLAGVVVGRRRRVR